MSTAHGAPPVTWARLEQCAAAVGLAVRGACHLAPGEFAAALPPRCQPRTIVLLGFTGSLQWPRFAAAPEAQDGAPHPLDRWSRRLIDALAQQLGAQALYPNDTPALPFQRLALRAEALHQSPLGLLIHPQWGLWHAYRGALAFAERLALPEPAANASPCASCRARPCLGGCPVHAFAGGTLDVGKCVSHVQSEAGVECRERGCLARRACPVGAPYRYVDAQMQFHQRAFLRAVAAAAR